MATDPPTPSNVPKPEPYEEPPPPYPGLADTANQVQPPPYSEPGSAYGVASASVCPPPYSASPFPGVGQLLPGAVGPLPHQHFTTNDRILSSVPVYADGASATVSGNCPNCEYGRLVGTVDVTLIICLVVMAFLLTPFTLCCIPCAFRQECPRCGYRTG